MNKEKDAQIKTSWFLQLENGERIYDKRPPVGGYSYWKTVKDLNISQNEPIAIGLYSDGEKETRLHSHSAGFLFLKRACYVLGAQESIELIGIGGYDIGEDTVKITWYDNSLTAAEHEERNIEKCKDIMIIRNSTASLFQS